MTTKSKTTTKTKTKTKKTARTRTKLKPATKKRWLVALRSGDYRQGKDYLCKASGGRSQHCCLGVLYDSEFDGDWHWDADPHLGGSWVTELFPDDDMSDQVLTHDQCKVVGLTMSTQGKLAAMNDDGKSFDEIADWIEKHL